MNILNIIGRETELFDIDMDSLDQDLNRLIAGSRILVIGGAGSIGQAVTIELFRRQPLCLHAVDLSENNLVELVRTIRSTIGYNNCEFSTFAIDCGGLEFDALCASQEPYDYVFNLSALKHVRSESDPYTLMRMIDTNIFNTLKTVELSSLQSVKNYFCVSTDKAANPVNMMGASKRIMEHFLIDASLSQNLTMARFANVAFSDGSLLHGFNQRFMKKQPISAPNDVRRYFLTPKESGQLCMLSGLLGKNREIYFPKLDENVHLETFSEIAIRFLSELGFEAFECASEDEARSRIDELIPHNKWPVYFFRSDTTGEKDFEEFYTENEVLDMSRYHSVGIIRNDISVDIEKLQNFKKEIAGLKKRGFWSKSDLVSLFNHTLPEFCHVEKGKYLNERM